MLTDRQKEILNIIIEEFINSAEPVSSAHIVRKYKLPYSSATVRNEMAELENGGFITKSHGYSGRLPLDKGYRFYVDNFVKSVLKDLNSDILGDIERFDNVLKIKNDITDEFLMYITKILSDVSGEAVFLLKKEDFSNEKIKNVKVLKTAEKVFIVFYVNDKNLIKSKVWFYDKKLTQNDIDVVTNFINHYLKQFSYKNFSDKLDLIFEKEKSLKIFSGEIKSILNLIFSEDTSNLTESNLFTDGLKKLIEKPEFSSSDKVSKIIELFENKKILTEKLEALLNLPQDGIIFKIGHEFADENLNDFSLASIPYFSGGKKQGIIGILGPKRMRYKEIAGIIINSSKRISKILSLLEKMK